jgi:glucuronate isomerase
MLYSQGISLEALGIPGQDGRAVEGDHRKIWQLFADHFHLFRGTPTGLWLKDELIEVFGIERRLNGSNAQAIFDELTVKLAEPAFSPKALFERFNIEVLCTTDTATDELQHHQQLRDDGWTQVRPTFRPDQVVNLGSPGWQENISVLSERSGLEITNYYAFITALEERRRFFKELGATATDHAALKAHTEALDPSEAERIFERALQGRSDADDAARFTAHMLQEMARMSCEDGLVMQLHVGSHRNHHQAIHRSFGRDKGGDIPVSGEWTRALSPLLNTYGDEPALRLILFTLDETTYGRELAPLAGLYPCLLLGPPWWFYDSVLGIERYLDSVIETAGLYNTAGFNDDTRAFASIPSRHDVWRRVTCNWLAGMTLRGFVDETEALEMAHELAYGLAKRAYSL